MNIYNKNNWHGISFNYSESVPYNKAKGITKFLFFGGIILLFAGVLLSFYSFFWGSIPVLTGVEMIAIMPLTMSNKARTLKIIIACVIPAGVILYLLIKFVFLDNPEMVKYFFGDLNITYNRHLFSCRICKRKQQDRPLYISADRTSIRYSDKHYGHKYKHQPRQQQPTDDKHLKSDRWMLDKRTMVHFSQGVRRVFLCANSSALYAIRRTYQNKPV